MAKALIMLVRVLGLIAIIIGALLWSGHATLLGPHIGLGFIVAMVIFILSVLALTRKAIVPGIAGVILALLLPLVGFMQLPLTVGGIRPVQIVHFMLALMAIGLAERLYSSIGRAH